MGCGGGGGGGGGGGYRELALLIRGLLYVYLLKSLKVSIFKRDIKE